MEFYSYMLTITGFSKILYKNQITEQWKDKMHSKRGVWWGNGKLWKIFHANEYKRLKLLSLKKRRAVSEMSST